MTTMTGHSSPQATSLQSEVIEVEKDLTLRCLLWESLQEWQGLVDQWEATPFETLKIDEVQHDVTRFIQTVFLLEKGRTTRTLLGLVVFLRFGRILKRYIICGKAWLENSNVLSAERFLVSVLEP